MRSNWLPFLTWVIVLFTFRCNTSDDVMPIDVSQDSTILSFFEDAANDSFLLDASGIYAYPITLNPSGASGAGAVVSIYYSLSLLDGTLIDSYGASDGDPLVMRQGANAIYPVGLDAGLALMNQGETYGFVLPSTLAYDTVNFSSVPLNSIVQFEVELVQVRSEGEIGIEEDTLIANYIEDAFLDSLDLVPLDSVEFIGQTNAIAYKRLAAGNGTIPRNGELININYLGRFAGPDSVVFDQRYQTQPFEYTFNTGLVIPGLDIGIGEMEFGERALIIMPSSFAYRESAAVIPPSFGPTAVESRIVPDYVLRVGPYEPLSFEVTIRPSN